MGNIPSDDNNIISRAIVLRGSEKATNSLINTPCTLEWIQSCTSLFLDKVRKTRGFVCGRTILHSWIGLDVKPPSHLTIV